VLAAFALIALSQAPARHTVAVDLSGLDAAAYRRVDAVGLETRAVLRLVQEGFAVVAPSGGPEITVRVKLSRDAVLLECGGSKRSVPIGDGPVREIRAGSAYWSVDDPTTVLTRRANGTELCIRWPGGTEQRVPLTAGQRAIVVSKGS